MEREEIIENFSNFIRENYYENLLKAVSEGVKFLLIDFSLLDKNYPELASYLLENPEETIEACEEAVKQIDTGLGETELRLRFVNLPPEREIRIRNIRSQHLGKMIVVDGFVKRASEIRPEVCESVYECLECGNTIEMVQKERVLKTPEKCEACGAKKGFKLIRQKFYDARWIVVEEPYEITTGERPSELMIYLKEDLTSPKMQNKTEPGNRIKVVGILKELPRRVKGTRSRQMEIYLDANSVESVEVGWEEFEITPEDEKKILEMSKDPEIFSKFIASIAPSMYGMEEVKEALLLQLVGGEPHLLPDGTRIRGNIHILLVGDPASGKSQLMQYISKLIPRGRYVSGSGVTGVGLCTVYDTLIQLEDGTLMKIGDLVEKEFERNKPEKVKEGIYRVKASDELKILAFNQKNLKIEPKKITYYWKVKAPHELVEIETRSGRKIIVTPENPIPIVNHGKIVWIKARDLNSNHYIATPRVIKVSSKSQTILDKIEKNAHVLNSFSTVAYLIEKIKEKYTLREFCRKFGINEENLYYNWKKYSPNLAELEKIANCLSLNLEEILPNELWLSQYHGHQLKLPLHLNEDIMYLMGLIAGDGSISETRFGGFDIKFFNIHDYLLNVFSSLCEKLIGIKPSYDEDRNGVPYYRFHSKIFGNLLKKFGISDGDKSHNLTISEELSKLPNALISSYLRGIFDTDGSVVKVKRKGSNFIELSSASEEFIRGMQLILLRFGIISRVRERGPKTSKIRGKLVKSGKKYVLEIRGVNNLKKFEESIGFSLPEKSRKLKEIIEKVSKEHTNVDLVPQIGELLKEARKKLKLSAKDFYGYKNYSYEKNKRYPTREFLQSILNEFGTKNLEELKKFADSDIFWDKVKRVRIIENKEHEYVYDVSVEDAHSFVGNGIVIHNTAAVTRDEEFLGGWVLEAGAIVMSNKSVCCLHPSSKIIINNEIVPIENLFNEKNSEKILCNGEIMEICKLKGCVPSLDIKSLRVKEQASNLVRRKRYEGKILKIKLDSGFEIKVTPEHMLIDGNTLSWKKAEDFKEGEFLLAPLNFPGENKKIYIFDLIPEDWKVCLTKKEKNEIKAEIIKKYKSIAEFSRKLALPKKIFYGGCQPTLKQFKNIIKELEMFEKWIKKPLKYGRKHGRIRLKIAEVTPELGYVLGFILGDGYLSRKESHSGVRITQSIKHKLFIKKLIENWNKVFPKELHEWEDNRESKIRGRNVKSNSKVLYFGSALLVLLYDKLVGKNLEKILCLPTEVLKSFIAGVFDSDGCISVKKGKKKNKEYKVAHVEFLISKNPEINKNFMLALRRLDVYSKLIKTDKNVDIIRITGREDVIKLKNSICKYSEKINLKEIPERIHKVSSSSDKLPAFLVAEICKKILEEINTTLLNKYGLRAIYPYKNLKYQPSREEMKKIFRAIGKNLSLSTRTEIEKLLQRDFFLDKIVKIEKEDYDGFVFDLFVPKTNNFVADGIFVHNCIDEFSKVSPGDRVALQEAMSLETISIAKASIVATLPAQTAILAGANPKLGRFDPYLPIREQVDIDDVLLSRFDLKFALRDIPNPELDSKMAEYILKVRHLRTEEAKPIIPPEFLRKYIAYARSKVHPVLTSEAGELLMNFYLEMRKKSGEEAPVSITLRQYEALIRLAEASAKIRLSNFVTREDAERAIRLMKISLREFGFEPETGMFDIDRAEGQKVTAAQRGKIRKMIDILEELTVTYGKNIPQEEFFKRAKEEGIEDVEEILRKMISEGIVFQPKAGFIQKV